MKPLPYDVRDCAVVVPSTSYLFILFIFYVECAPRMKKCITCQVKITKKLSPGENVRFNFALFVCLFVCLLSARTATRNLKV